MKALKKIKPIWIVVALIVLAIGIWYWKVGRFVGLPSLDGKKKEDQPDTKGTAPSGSNYTNTAKCDITKANWSKYKDLVLKVGSPHRCAIKLMQSVIGINADGVFGPITERAVSNIMGSKQTTLKQLDTALGNKIYQSLSIF